jgi:hypothetical protein
MSDTVDGEQDEEGDEVNVVPQADDLAKVRAVVHYWSNPGGTVASAIRTLGLAKRAHGYNSQAARCLGFLERRNAHEALTAAGHSLLRASPGSEVEREIILSALDCAPVLAPLRAYLHGDEPLTRDELRARVATTPGIGGTTLGRRASAMLAWRDYLGTTDDAAQLQLFDPSASDVQWPAMERFPHNRPRHHVAQVVFGDLHASEQPLIVAGYSALGELLRLVAAVTEKQTCIRILFGEEPFLTSRTRFVLGRNSFADEVREHWLERWISLRLSGAVVRAKELLTAQRLVTRLQRAHQELHAKIYVGDNAATIGSSNFTDPGLRRKREGNARFTKHGETKRYEETSLDPGRYGTALVRTCVEVRLGSSHEVVHVDRALVSFDRGLPRKHVSRVARSRKTTTTCSHLPGLARR